MLATMMCMMVVGVRGEVIHVTTNSDNKATHILIKFDNLDVGVKTKIPIPDTVNLSKMKHHS